MIEISNISGTKILARVPLGIPVNLAGMDLQHAKLDGLDLRNADFRAADLRHASFEDADLSGADLRKADCTDVFIHDTKLNGLRAQGAAFNDAQIVFADAQDADFEGAQLGFTRWIFCDLRNSNLRMCSMDFAFFHDVKFARANLSESEFSSTTFVGCDDLHHATGLLSLSHSSPSSIDVHTVRSSIQGLPDEFLIGCGYSIDEIEYLRDIYRKGIEFYSCFLSHADSDAEFADRLRSGLIANNVNCWHYRFDMQGGKPWRTQVQTAIKIHDKLVLICSEHSVVRQNVVDEIIAAMERERETGEQKLFPIRLDDFILGRDMLSIADAAMESGRWREDWVRYVRSYHIPDFSGWKDHDSYQREFQKLIRDLKNPEPR